MSNDKPIDLRVVPAGWQIGIRFDESGKFLPPLNPALHRKATESLLKHAAEYERKLLGIPEPK
jgi:hypothetical protein